MSRGAALDRWHEVEERLERAGLPRVPHAETRRAIDPDRQARLRRLRAALVDLGPVFTAFGRYLSTRLDILSGEDSRELLSLPEALPPMPEAAVHALLRSELGLERSRYVVEIERPAVESAPFTQTHRAQLSDGRAVTLKVARTDVPWDADGALLSELAGRLVSFGWAVPVSERMIADFREVVARRRNLLDETAALRRLALLPPDALRATAPTVIETLSSDRVLTLDPFGSDPPFAASETPTPATRHLADLWLHLVLTERLVPEDWSGSAIRSSADGTLSVTGGLFHPLRPEEAEALSRYLVAAARDDPEGVFEALSVVATTRADARPEAFHHCLGHVVPRRDGRFGAAPPGFPETLLSHWPLLEQHGLLSRPALRAFFRGLVILRDLMGPALSNGVFKESHQAAQAWDRTKRLGRALDGDALTRGAEQVVQAIVRAAQSIEEKRAARRRGADPRPEVETERERPAAWTGPAAGLLLASTLTIWLYRLPPFFGSGVRWLLVGAVTLIGLALVRSIARR